MSTLHNFPYYGLLWTFSLIHFTQFGPHIFCGRADGLAFTPDSTNIFSIIVRLFYRSPPIKATLSTPQIITLNGYDVEEHKVETKDGYILTMFRIFGKNTDEQNQKEKKAGRPVVLQHGDFSSSNDWLLLPTNVALPYLLSDKNHDVWLGNARGNNYSMEHTRLGSNDQKFWDFGYDEIGSYDIPAVIEYVLQVTNYDRLNWVGHSAGTSTFFIAMDQRPELNDKVNKMVALSPSFHIANSRFRLETLIPPDVLRALSRFVSGGRFVPQRIIELLHRLAPAICYGDLPREICNNFLYFTGGHNPQQVTAETASLVYGHTPSDTSAKLVIQMGQSVRAGKLRHFDYGVRGNQEKYGVSNPPDYNLTKVQVSVQAFYGLNDARNDPKDAKKTISELGNVEAAVEVADPKWGHLDFMYGKEARHFVYDYIVEYLVEK